MPYIELRHIISGVIKNYVSIGLAGVKYQPFYHVREVNCKYVGIRLKKEMTLIN